MIAIGIDTGYGYSKVASLIGESMFASVIGTPDTSRFGLSTDSSRIMVVDGTAYLVGEAAIEQSRFLQRREDRRWIESPEYRVLFLAALDLAINGNGGEHQALLVTGLPLAFYDDKEALQRRLLGTHTIQRQGQRPRHVRVQECRVVPQPFGSLFSLAFNAQGQVVDSTLLEGKVGIIDVGSKTTNLLSTTRARELRSASSSISAGGWDVVRAVREYLGSTCRDADPRDHEIAEAIARRQYRYYGRTIDLAPVMADHYVPLAERIISTASQLWNHGAAMDTILLTGGGAHLVGDMLSGYFERHADFRIVPDAQMANCRGYYRFAQHLARG